MSRGRAFLAGVALAALVFVGLATPASAAVTATIDDISRVGCTITTTFTVGDAGTLLRAGLRRRPAPGRGGGGRRRRSHRHLGLPHHRGGAPGRARPGDPRHRRPGSGRLRPRLRRSVRRRRLGHRGVRGLRWHRLGRAHDQRSRHPRGGPGPRHGRLHLHPPGRPVSRADRRRAQRGRRCRAPGSTTSTISRRRWPSPPDRSRSPSPPPPSPMARPDPTGPSPSASSPGEGYQLGDPASASVVITDQLPTPEPPTIDATISATQLRPGQVFTVSGDVSAFFEEEGRQDRAFTDASTVKVLFDDLDLGDVQVQSDRGFAGEFTTPGRGARAATRCGCSTSTPNVTSPSRCWASPPPRSRTSRRRPAPVPPGRAPPAPGPAAPAPWPGPVTRPSRCSWAGPPSCSWAPP